MQRLAHSILLLGCLLAGCGRHELAPGVTDSAFVATMADLRRLQGAPGDSATLAASRHRVLQQRGLTVEQLDRAAVALASDPQRASEIFEAIQKRATGVTDSTRAR